MASNGTGEPSAPEERFSLHSGLNYRALFESIYDGVLLFSYDNTIINANQQFAGIVGYTIDELIGMPTSQLVPPDERHNPDDQRPRLLRGERVAAYRRTGVRKDGTLLYADIGSAAVFCPDGSFSHFISVVHDVTPSVRLEARLSMLSLAVEQTPASVVITDTHGIICYVNPAFVHVTGYASSEAVGATPRILKSGLVPASVYDDMWRTITGGNVWSGELCNRRKNGELYWDLGTVSPLRDAHGAITHYVSVKEDITARKRNEEELARHRQNLEDLVAERTADLRAEIAVRQQTELALRDNELRLRQAQHIAHVGSWDWNAEDDSFIWSDETYRICGVDPQAFQPSFSAFLSMVHPSDRESVRSSAQQARSGGLPLSMNLRLQRPDGTLSVLSLIAAPVADGSGNVSHVAGTLRDITEEVRISQELIEKDRLTRELALGRRIQLSMLPQSCPVVAGWDFACHYRTAEQVGGDLYDFVPLPGDKLGILVGDVSGHGLPAALHMALCRSIIRTTARSNQDPSKTLVRSNKILFEDYLGDDFVTVCYGTLDTSQGVFLVANAGHCRPLLYSAATGKVEEVPVKGVMLGIMPRVALAEQSVALAPGDTLLLYTDGIVEANDARATSSAACACRRPWQPAAAKAQAGFYTASSRPGPNSPAPPPQWMTPRCWLSSGRPCLLDKEPANSAAPARSPKLLPRDLDKYDRITANDGIACRRQRCCLAPALPSMAGIRRR